MFSKLTVRRLQCRERIIAATVRCHYNSSLSSSRDPVSDIVWSVGVSTSEKHICFLSTVKIDKVVVVTFWSDSNSVVPRRADVMTRICWSGAAGSILPMPWRTLRKASLSNLVIKYVLNIVLIKIYYWIRDSPAASTILVLLLRLQGG